MNFQSGNKSLVSENPPSAFAFAVPPYTMRDLNAARGACARSIDGVLRRPSPGLERGGRAC